jgi:DNA-directed RNA polymerase specialized sigma24 family protein
LDPQKKDRLSGQPKSHLRSVLKTEWTPTQQAFEKFLAAFSSDYEAAAAQYELTRSKLIKFFERRAVYGSEGLADETLDRVMRRIDEGEIVTNMMAYVYKVASFVVLETYKEQEKLHKAEEATPLVAAAPPLTEGEENSRLVCFDRCLDGLPVETRTLILDYYREDGHEKIQLRRQIAEKLGIGLNALRIRTRKIRVKLEQCVKECLDQSA